MDKVSLEVSVVLVSYNTREMTLACLRSLFQVLGDLQFEAVVVDNASSDGSADAIKAEFPTVQVILSKVNLGFGKANNLAFQAAQAPLLFVLNTDTLVHANAVPAMRQMLEEDKQLAAVGCKLVNADGSLQRSCWSFPSPGRAWLEALGLNRVFARDWHRWSHDSEEKVDFVIGAAMLVRRAAIQSVGGFDEDFFLYAEEADWQKRMTVGGWLIGFTPKGTVVHFGGASGNGMPNRQLVESCRGTQRYILKHHGLIGLLSFRFAVILGLAMRIALRAPLFWMVGTARLNDQMRTLRYWLGLGPQQGFRELNNCDGKSTLKESRA